MAKPVLPYSNPSESSAESTTPTAGSYGAVPEVSASSLEPEGRVIRSVSQAYEVTQTDLTEAQKLIGNAGLITNLLQGARPYNASTLRNLNEGHKTNISTRAYGTELRRAAPRLYMPVLTASTLTAAQLPTGWPDAANKTAFFRETITEAIRGWPKNDFFWRGLGREVVYYAYTFACWPDKYEWRPSLVRMDRGFVPRGTEVMEENLSRFTLLYDYKPNELLALAKKAVDAGIGDWNKEAVAAAVQAADLPVTDYTLDGLRKWDELIREASWDFNYTKGIRVTKTRHLFVLEATGKVSHYIIWPDGPAEFQLLMERLDAFDSMNDVVRPLVAADGDGTIQGAWGAGHILYDMAIQLDQIRCDSIDNLKMGNKLKIQVPDPKDINQVKLVVNSTAAILSNGTWANNVGGIAPATESYQIAEQNMARYMQEAIGAFLPPISYQSDVKAAQVNAALAQQQEIERDVLESWMKQVAFVVATMTKRLCNPDSPDATAKKTRKLLLEGRNGLGLTEQEIALFCDQPAIQSVTDFTQFMASQKAAFAASVKGDPRFNQTAAARMQCEGVPGGGLRLADELVAEDSDPTIHDGAVRQQKIESFSMQTGMPIDVLTIDMHEIHLETLKPGLESAIVNGLLPASQALLKHAQAHFLAGSSLKVLKKESVNQWKSWLALQQKAVEALQQQKAEEAQAAALAQGGAPIPFPAQPEAVATETVAVES